MTNNMKTKYFIYVIVLIVSTIIISYSCNKNCDSPKCFYINERASVKLGKEITIMDTTRMVLNKKGKLVPYEYHIKYTKVIHDGRDYVACSASTGGQIESEALIYTDSSSVTDTLEFRGCTTADKPITRSNSTAHYYTDTEVDHKVIYFLRNRPLAVKTDVLFKWKKEDYPYTLELILKDN
jgi:hypothetical protein